MTALTEAELADFRQWASVMATASGNGGDVRAMQVLKLLAVLDAREATIDHLVESVKLLSDKNVLLERKVSESPIESSAPYFDGVIPR
jgi:hypothetical protein